MSKEDKRISTVMEQYGDILRKYGLYMLVILFVFGAVFGYVTQFAQKEQENKTEIIIKDLDIKPEVKEINKKEAIEKTKEIEVEKNEVQENNSKKTTEIEEKEEKPAIAKEVKGQNVAFVWPIRGEIIAGYGLKYSDLYEDYRLHPGIDIKGSDKEEIKASEAGKVSLIEKTEAQMVTIEIEHNNGWLSRYCHLVKANVKKDQQVKKGDIIGILGQPGLEEEKDGCHLHFEIKENQKWVDPEKYLD